jgi:sulfatase maturation enzyme AslB (radical SAM superfamily)
MEAILINVREYILNTNIMKNIFILQDKDNVAKYIIVMAKYFLSQFDTIFNYLAMQRCLKSA